jgi:hypothetical protein
MRQSTTLGTQQQQRGVVAVSLLIIVLGFVLFFLSLLWGFWTESLSLWNWGLLAVSSLLILAGYGSAGDGSWKLSLASLLYSFFTMVCCIAVYLISTNRDWEWDFSVSARHTLAPQAVETVRALTRPVTITAFQPIRTQEEAARFLELFAKESPFLNYRLLDPAVQIGEVQEFGDNILPNDVIISTPMEEGTRSVRTVFKVDDPKREQVLTNALLELEYGSDQRIYFSRGKGERSVFTDNPSGNTISTLGRELEAQSFPIAELNLQTLPSIPSDAAVVVLFTPQVDLLDSERLLLEEYLLEGGKLFLAWEPNFERDEFPNLESLLMEVGISTRNSIVVDPQASSQASGVAFAAPTGAHPITQNSPNIIFRHYLARPFEMDASVSPHTPELLPILVSHEGVWEENARFLKRVQRSSRPTDPKEIGVRIIALSSEFPTPAGIRGKEARVITLGDGDFLSDQYIADESLTLALFSFNWLTQREAQLSIPPRKIAPSRFDLTQQTLYLISGSLLFMSLLVLAGGLFFTNMRRRHG